LKATMILRIKERIVRMRASVFLAPGDIKIEDRSKPEIDSNEYIINRGKDKRRQGNCNVSKNWGKTIYMNFRVN
jgi:ArsR family metal-binding transcriptional regulator